MVSGRIKHFTSAFGEHVIASEVEYALKKAASELQIVINEFTVAPQINPEKGLPYHEWFIEFGEEPESLNIFAKKLDHHLQQKNSYYLDLIQGKILKRLVISPLQKNSFQQYMKSVGKLGGQNKLPRLSNDRKIANALEAWKVEKPHYE